VILDDFCISLDLSNQTYDLIWATSILGYVINIHHSQHIIYNFCILRRSFLSNLSQRTPDPKSSPGPQSSRLLLKKKAEKDIFHLIFLFLKTTEKDKNNLLRNDGGLSYLSNYEKLEP